MTQCCQRCRHVLPSEFFYRKRRHWKTCTECSNKKGKKQYEIPATLPDPQESTEAHSFCKGCRGNLPVASFVRRGRTWGTCNTCSEKRCSNKDITPPLKREPCSVCWVTNSHEEHKRRNRYWAICNKCAKRKMLNKRKSTKHKHDSKTDSPLEVLPDGRRAPDT